MKYTFTLALVLVSIISFAQSNIKWNTANDISGSTYGNNHPRITLDGKGNPMVIWGRLNDEALLFSRWNGTIFTTPVKLNPTGMTVATAGWMGPDIASKGDTVYVVMKRTPEVSDTNHIFLMSSFNGGLTFSSPVRVDFIGDSLSRFPTVTVDETGNPVVAFMKFNSSFLESRWVVTKSADFGKTFSVDVDASGYSGAESEACNCCPGAIVTSGNVSAMLYRDNLKNIRDIWTGISTNNNTSFKNGFAVDNTKWMIMSCPSSGPDGAIIGDSLYTVYMGDYKTYLSRSSISSGELVSVTKLTGNTTGIGQQNYPRIATNGKAAAIVWKQNVSGSAQLPLLFTNDITKGFAAAYEMVDMNDITNADVAMNNKSVFVVWQDDKAGTIKYRSGIYATATSISEIEKVGFTMYPNPASTVLNIQFDASANPYTAIKIVDALGATVLYMHNPKNASAAIDISGLNSGIYFIQLINNNVISTQKFIKQ